MAEMAIITLLSVLTFILHRGASQHYPAKPYHFKYEVADDITGDYHGHTETKAGDGTVSGSYFLLSPDGIWRETKYTDKGYGFEAVQQKTPLNNPPYQRTGSTFSVYQSAGPGSIGAPNSLLGKPVLHGHSLGEPVSISFKAPSKSGIGSQHGFGGGTFDSQRGSGFGSNLGGASFQGRPSGGFASPGFGGNGGGIGGGIDGSFEGGLAGPLGPGNDFSGTGSLGGGSFGGPANGFGGNLLPNFQGIDPSQNFGAVGGGDGLGIDGPQNFNGGLGNQFGGNPFGGNQFGGNQFGGNQFGGNQFGGNQFGGNQFGNDQFGGNQFREEFDGKEKNVGVPGSGIKHGQGKDPGLVGFGEVSPFGQPGGNAFGGGAIDVGQLSGNVPLHPGAEFSGGQGGFPINNGGGSPGSPLGFNNFGNNIDGSSPGFGGGLGGNVGHPDKNVDPIIGKPFRRPEFQNHDFPGGIQGNDAFNAGGLPHGLGSGAPPLDGGPVGFEGVNSNAGINLGGDFGRPLSQAGPGLPGGGGGFNSPQGNKGASFFTSGGIGFGGVGEDFRASNDIGRPLIPGGNLGIGPDVGGPIGAFGNPSLGIGPDIGPNPGFGSDIGTGPGIGRPPFGGGPGPVIGRPSFDGRPDIGPGPGFGRPLLGGGSDIGPGPGFGRPFAGGGPDIGPNTGFGGSFNEGVSNFGSNAGFDESFNGGGSDFGLNSGLGRPLIGGGPNIGPKPGFGRPPIGGGPDVGPGPEFGRPLFGGGSGLSDQGLGGPGGFASGINNQGFGGPGGFASGINDQGFGGPGGFASGINDQGFGGPGGFAGGPGGFQGANQVSGFGSGNNNGVPLFNLGEGANFRSSDPGFRTNLGDQGGVGNPVTGSNNGQGNVQGFAGDFDDFVGDIGNFGNTGNFGVSLEDTNNFQRFGNNFGAPQGNSLRVNGGAASNNIFGKRAVPAKRITSSSSLRIAGRDLTKKEHRASNTNTETTQTINKSSTRASKIKRNNSKINTSSDTSDNSPRTARKRTSTNNKATGTDSLTKSNRKSDTDINNAGISADFTRSMGVASTMQDIFRKVQEGFATL